MSFEWERALGEFHAWRAKQTARQKQIKDSETTEILRERGLKDYNTVYGRIWAEPGVELPIPRSGFFDPNAPARSAEPAAPSDLQTIIERAVANALAKAGIGKTEA
jgi:hypothetical protein